MRGFILGVLWGLSLSASLYGLDVIFSAKISAWMVSVTIAGVTGVALLTLFSIRKSFKKKGLVIKRDANRSCANEWRKAKGSDLDI